MAKHRAPGLIRRLLGSSGAAAGPFPYGPGSSGDPVVSFTPQLIEALKLVDHPIALERLYQTQPAVRICVDFLAENIAHTRLKAYHRTSDSREEVPFEHPLAKVLRQPNSFMNGFDLIYGTVADMAIFDAAYWWKVVRGDQIQLFRIPPRYILAKQGDILTGPAWYEMTTTSGPRHLQPSEVVDFSGYNPWDTRVGLSVLLALSAVLTEEVEASRYRTKLWQQGARQQGFLQRPKDSPPMDELSRQSFRSGLNEFTRGGAKEGQWMLLEEGEQPFPIAFSPKDAEFIAGRNWALDTVATAYRIPLSVLSRGGTFTFASMVEFHKMVYVDTLGPWNARIENKIDAQLLPEFNDPSLYVEFNIEEKLQGDFESSAAAFRSHVQVPDMSVNESRRLQNLPRIDDPEFDIPAKPTNYNFGTPDVGPAPGVPLTNGQSGMSAADLEQLLEGTHE